MRGGKEILDRGFRDALLKSYRKEGGQGGPRKERESAMLGEKILGEDSCHVGFFPSECWGGPLKEDQHQARCSCRNGDWKKDIKAPEENSSSKKQQKSKPSLNVKKIP